MTAKPLPPIAVLRQLLRYEPDTGKLFWLERHPSWFPKAGRFIAEAQARMWNGKHAGREAAGEPDAKDGYRRMRITARTLLAHRVAYAVAIGDFTGEIDHINGVRHDNRLSNLRAVDRFENMKNKAAYKSNSSGVVGVSWNKRERKWRAYISIDGKFVVLGSFVRKSDAIATRRAVEAGEMYHANHGRLTPLK